MRAYTTNKKNKINRDSVRNMITVGIKEVK